LGVFHGDVVGLFFFVSEECVAQRFPVCGKYLFLLQMWRILFHVAVVVGFTQLCRRVWHCKDERQALEKVGANYRSVFQSVAVGLFQICIFIDRMAQSIAGDVF